MRLFAGILGFAVAWLPASARAQSPVDPGGVATTVVTLAVPEAGAGDSVAYRVDMAEGFNLFAPAEGRRPVGAGPIRIPLTFGVAPAAPAGPVEVGRVIATWSGGAESVAPVSVRVRPRYGLRFWVGRRVVTGAPETPVEFTFHVRNQGNTTDTVSIVIRAPDGWAREALPARTVLAPNDTVSGTIQLIAPRREGRGSEAMVAVEARSPNARETASVRFVTVTPTRWFGNLASVPSTVFLGSAPGSEGLGSVAVQAAGELRPGTRMSLRFRHTDQPFIPPALRNDLSGPRFRLSVEEEHWKVSAGDVYSRPDLFTGPSVHGIGTDLHWEGPDRGADLMVALPSNGLGSEEGILARASGYLATDRGRFTAVVSELRRDAEFLEGFGVRSLGLRYDVSDGVPGQIAVQAGVMQVTTDSSGSAIGPAVEAEYFQNTESHSLLARLRRVPATVPRTTAHGDELLLSATARLIDGLAAVGWGYATRSPLIGVEDPASGHALTMGLRYVHAGHGAQMQLTGQLRASETPYLGSASARRTLRASFNAPLGPMALDLTGEWGRAESTVDTVTRLGPYRTLRTGLRWNTALSWAWAGVTYRDPGVGEATAFANLGVALRLTGIEIEGGLSANLDPSLAEGTSFWAGTRFGIARTSMATVGIDYSPTTRWRVSLGVSREFTLPLPLPRQPVVRGVVYEDQNGNRVRDPAEPLLTDVTVRLGVLRVTTDSEGAFRFNESVEGALRVDPRDLPPGLMVPVDVHLPVSGFVEIPVVRTAALELTLFIDRDNDGTRDATESPAGGVVVSLVARNGRSRDVASNEDGTVRVSALAPGEYTLRIHPPSTRRTGGPALERTLTVEPGATVTETIPVPIRQREIRIPDRQRLRNEPEPQDR